METENENQIDHSPNKFIGLVLDNKYEIEELLGAGSTGFVYKGTHRMLNIPVAIKILHPNLISNDIAQKRFRLEAKTAIMIHHPNAMSVMDFGISGDNIYYLILEYISGISLIDMLRQGKKLDIARAIKITKQICQALEAAHQNAIVHRDLKPGNIMIIKSDESNDIVKVIDFSIAKQLNENSNLTGKDTVLGTPQYISPEQVQ